jgi:hydrogenase maturation factor HypE
VLVFRNALGATRVVAQLSNLALPCGSTLRVAANLECGNRMSCSSGFSEIALDTLSYSAATILHLC